MLIVSHLTEKANTTREPEGNAEKSKTIIIWYTYFIYNMMRYELRSAEPPIERPCEEAPNLRLGEVGVHRRHRPAAVKPVVYKADNEELVTSLQGWVVTFLIIMIIMTIMGY